MKKIVTFSIEELTIPGSEGTSLVDLGFSGSLSLFKPGIEEAISAQELATKLQKDADMKAVIDLIKWSKPFYSSVELMLNDDLYASFDDLYEDAECMPLLTAVAGLLVRGAPKKKQMSGKL